MTSVTTVETFRACRKYSAMHFNTRNLFFKKLFKWKHRAQPSLAN